MKVISSSTLSRIIIRFIPVPILSSNFIFSWIIFCDRTDNWYRWMGGMKRREGLSYHPAKSTRRIDMSMRISNNKNNENEEQHFLLLSIDYRVHWILGMDEFFQKMLNHKSISVTNNKTIRVMKTISMATTRK